LGQRERASSHCIQRTKASSLLKVFAAVKKRGGEAQNKKEEKKHYPVSRIMGCWGKHQGWGEGGSSNLAGEGDVQRGKMGPPIRSAAQPRSQKGDASDYVGKIHVGTEERNVRKEKLLYNKRGRDRRRKTRGTGNDGITHGKHTV